MTPFSEIVEGMARDVCLLDGERLDDDSCPAEKHVALARDFRPGLALNDDGELQKAPCTDETAVRVVDQAGAGNGFGFPEQNGAEMSRIILVGRVRHTGVRRDRDTNA